jgi:large subunit ribosomal protein L35
LSRRKSSTRSSDYMPKMKTHRGAAKRFRVTGKGKLMRKKAYNSHLFASKSAKRLRSLERQQEVSASDDANIRKALGIGKGK